MNPIAEPSRNPLFSPPVRSPVYPALAALACCALMGLAVVVWRAGERSEAWRSRARSDAAACAAQLEGQFRRSVGAVETIAALVRQSGGVVPDLQRIAAPVLAADLNLASLHIQRGGVITDIAPRAGNERWIGWNVLSDPSHRAAAELAVQRRAPAAAGPVRLRQGGLAMVVQAPVFTRGADGRESLWGYVGASVEAPGRPGALHLAELAQHGYEYSLLLQGWPQQSLTALAYHGRLPLSEAVVQPLRAANLGLMLAVRPPEGWLNRSRARLESVAVLCWSGLLGLVIWCWGRERRSEEGLGEAERGLARETALRKQALEDYRSAKETATVTQEKLKQAETALKQAESGAADLRTRLDAAVREATETRETGRARLEQVELEAREVRSKLEVGVRAANEAAVEKEAQLGQARRELLEQRDKAEGLEGRLEAAARAYDEATNSAQIRLVEAQAAIAALQTRLEDNERSNAEAAATAQKRLQERQGIVTALEVRLEAAVRAQEEAVTAAAQSAREQQQTAIADLERRLAAATQASSEAAKAHSARIQELEEANREMMSGLQAAKHAGASVVELTGRLQETRAELQRLKDSGSEETAAGVADAGAEPAAPGEPQPDQASSAPAPEAPSDQGADAAAQGPPAATVPSEAPTPTVPALEAEAPSTPAAESVATAAPAPTEPPVPPADPAAPVTPSSTPSEPAPEASAVSEGKRTAPTSRRKKGRRESQIEMFTAPAAAVESAPAPATEPALEPSASSAPASAEAPEAAKASATSTATDAGVPLEPVAVEGEAPAVVPAPAPSTEPPAEPPAETPPSMDAVELPVIDGLAASEALERAGGDVDGYLANLRRFAEEQAAVPGRVRDALVQGDGTVAQGLLDGLETAATAIGATTVQRAAIALSRAVGSHGESSEVEALWQDLEQAVGSLLGGIETAFKAGEEKRGRASTPLPPADIAALRKALRLMLPLLSGRDPGAKDCLRANRAVFRSVFSTDGYAEFEQFIKRNNFSAALEQLTKAAKKHGITV